MTTETLTGAEQLYAEGYAVFMRNTEDDRPPLIRFMEEHLRRAALARGRDISTLSVGCGDGSFDEQVVALLRGVVEPSKERYVAVDPNATHLQAFAARALAPALKAVDFDFRPMRFEEFSTTEQFHCIHFTHSLYHMPGSEGELVARARRMLHRSGRLFLVIQDSQNGVRQMTKRYIELAGSYAQDNSLGSDELAAILTRTGIPFVKDPLPLRVDVTECFEERSPDAELFLCFLCQADVRAAPSELRRKLMAHLDSISRHDGSRRFLAGNTCAFAIEAEAG